MRRSALGALGIVVAAFLAGCGAGPPTSSMTGSPTGPAPSSGSPVPSIPVGPTVTFDPADLGAPGPPPVIDVRGSETAGGVITDDVSFSSAVVPPTDAYLVRPARAGKRPAPAALWFHWLETGASTSNRSEFLDEAQALAARGVISVLVQGTFPWRDRPTSLAHDLAAVEADVRMLRAALDLLVARTDVDPDRVAIVGHDFGAMYASVVFGSDPRASMLVMMAPTARWGDWFLQYWAIADPRPAYLAAMAPLDPVTWLRRADGRPILLQLAAHDPYVSGEVAKEIGDAAGSTGETRTYDAGHALDAAARADRDAWLADRLGLG